MENFTPVSALIGGAFIGLSASLLLLSLGRIAGISGIIGSLLTPGRSGAPWRLPFVIGLLLGPFVVMIIGSALNAAPPEITIEASWPTLVLGGLLVGFGTRLGSGCTSGHGVCGIARLSPRSLVATGLFMAAGAAVVFIARHVIGG
ncbi:YeeE/YedE family protein [Aquibaculum arenosum]|uniref:YeeE/YedE family protein n=1 Tax=Aquibaculum arenosum TaxID=3032591 RepID=A0ABT5YMN5_9PROT|nr:YeeE/YedE family protein [Fodinicurvata sp. CAU 1616]MDF2096226.1 YeeE/YedE family protein [Fodinicurvata sp. CAU 1616]